MNTFFLNNKPSCNEKDKIVVKSNIDLINLKQNHLFWCTLWASLLEKYATVKQKITKLTIVALSIRSWSSKVSRVAIPNIICGIDSKRGSKVYISFLKSDSSNT